MREALVSVIMPVWNPELSQFRMAVESVLAQSFDRFELIVVEDASERNCSEVLDSLDDARIRHVCNREKGSMAIARNQGLELAAAPIVAMLDADDVCELDRIEAQYEWMQSHPDTAVLGSQLTIIDSESQEIGHRQYPTSHAEILDAFRLFNPIAHPSVMFRKDAVLAHGPYPLRPDCACEDYELWSMLARAGLRFANHDRALLRYRIHEGAMKSRGLRATLRDTVHIKKTYWKDQLGLRGRFRMLGERALLMLPASWVLFLFKHFALGKAAG